MKTFYVVNALEMKPQILGNFNSWQAAYNTARENGQTPAKGWKVCDEYELLKLASEILEILKRGKA